MNVPVEHLDPTTAVLRPVGRLDLRSAADVRTTATAAIDAGHHIVVVDLAEVTFMDSSGLGALIASLKVARQASGDLRICRANEQVLTVLELTKLQRVLRVHDSVESAVAAG